MKKAMLFWVGFSILGLLVCFFALVATSCPKNGQENSRVSASSYSENHGVITPLSSASAGKDTSQEKWQEDFLFVRDQIHFVPTRAVLRPSQGILWSRKGNAIEQALLLSELLRDEGEEVRIAFGQLSERTAQKLIESMFPNAPEFSYPPDVPLSSPAQDNKLIEAVKNHCWVQIRRGDEWIDLDPCFPESEVSQAFAPLEETAEEIGEDFFPEVTLSLEVEKGIFQDNRVASPETETVLDWTGTLREIACQPLSLKVAAYIQAVEQEEDEEEGSPAAGIFGGLSGRSSSKKKHENGKKEVEYRASLQIMGEEQDEGRFSQTIPPSPEEESITRIVLRFSLEIPGEDTVETIRVLFEKHKKEDMPHYFQRHAVLITGNEIPSEAWEKRIPKTMKPKKIEEMKKRLARIKSYLKDKKKLKEIYEDTLSLEQEIGPEAGHLLNLIFASSSDLIADEFARALSVFHFYSFPRILINTFEGTGENLRVYMDLRQDSLEAIPYPGQALKMGETFLYGRGVMESLLEGKIIEMLTGKPPLTTARAMEVAAEKNIPIRMISHLERGDLRNMDFPPSVLRKIEELIQSGRILIIPERSIRFDGTPRWGWWDLDPQTGAVVGVLDSGLHQAMIERTILDTSGMLHDDMGLVVGAMVGCVDTHWVLMALTLKYGELNKAALQEAKDYMKKIGSYLCPGLEKTLEVGIGVSAELEDCWKEEIGIGFKGGLKIEQGWCAKFTKGFQCASTTILNYYLSHAK